MLSRRICMARTKALGLAAPFSAFCNESEEIVFYLSSGGLSESVGVERRAMMIRIEFWCKNLDS